ncbi:MULTISPECIES: hypothetical protein [Bacillus amyloliquefaciens group]|uniref:DNA-directed RNA polymerase n=1 Tax=Bacillus velezensis TaxID=492670 RepID=A0ABC8D9X4_BACVE|nr:MULTISPECIES: hypothetical protein [Bacillus amyloliquefaciens group]ANB49257.1 hypothetical protein A1D33_018385 [Bacillus velezensis]AVI29013.1 hypothetical protein C3Z10_11755 [Bacillus velezensis]AWX72666.1 hypothetical protein BVDSYZ_11780 [Bacillus velezensis]MDK2560187.1 hypothetical protein [Bacillus amyloliquefaciens]WPB68816.1 hypothetical protein SBO70_11725 [Bacillus velezensis]
MKRKKDGLSKQVHIYSVDTSAFYNDKENSLHNKILKSYRYRDYLKTLDNVNNKHKKYISQRITYLKECLYSAFEEHNDIRALRTDSLRDNKVISLFDSVLTRTLGIKENTLSEEIMVVQTYHFEVLKDIIDQGFLHNNEKYVYFTSSAGQIRTKKSCFIKKSTYDKYQDALTCGLSIEKINSLGGSSINKWNSYMALSNSASSPWEIDIDKAIVVNDLETDVSSLVDYIDRDTYKITRKTMNIPIEHTDGCGMILPTLSRKSFMVRLPWVKGLLVPFDFRKFTEENKAFKVTDIYGKEWDVVRDDIQIIFTKSQFKMWKYYSSWEEYQVNYKKYGCLGAKLNEEDPSVEGKLTYQMLQTLTDISDKELIQMSSKTVKEISTLGTDKETMLRVLGATEKKKHRTALQDALLLYPELLNDDHTKEIIKNKKKSMIKDAKSGKLLVDGARYTYLCPDLYAFCEKLFLNIQNPKGLLLGSDVHCSLYDEGYIDILRSPHLFREHGVRWNKKDEKYEKWFITPGVYTSIHDPISKLLQFDNDGDKALIISDELIVNIAKRNMENIVPLYYEMSVAQKQEINSKNIYEALTLAYGINIGEYSNNITKIWNSDNINLDVIKWLCMENNFTIDFAKTLFMPTRPDHVDEKIKDYIKNKVPHFFINAKDKEEHSVELINESTVNKLDSIIPSDRINFASVAGKFDYRFLLKNKEIKLDEAIISEYKRLDQNKKWLMNDEDIKPGQKLYVYKVIKDRLLKIHNDEQYVTDVLVKYLYKKKSKFKSTLWECFGETLLENLRHNLKTYRGCCSCGKMFKSTSHKAKYCPTCAKKIAQKQKNKWKRDKWRKEEK